MVFDCDASEEPSQFGEVAQDQLTIHYALSSDFANGMVPVKPIDINSYALDGLFCHHDPNLLSVTLDQHNHSLKLSYPTSTKSTNSMHEIHTLTQHDKAVDPLTNISDDLQELLVTLGY